MSTLALPRRWSDTAAGSHSFADALGALARRVDHRVRTWKDQRRLEALPDYLLNDIGVSRGEIPNVTEFGRIRALGPAYRV